jgi:hypothetical protein
LLTPVDGRFPAYWVPPTSVESTIELEARSNSYLDCAVWRLPEAATELVVALGRPLVLERQPIFMLSSHTAFRGPGDVYAYLIHGHVYENRFDFRRNRKICSELEAYSLYLALHGLEGATSKELYRLLKQQIVYSVIARQARDGAWHHGEWTDLMESHYRFHNAAMLLLEAALEEAPAVALGNALKKAASVLSEGTDRTSIGLWFFHDSLEHSVEMTEKSGIRWIPSRELGKSPATKMILNSHLDAIVALDRYREVSADSQYSEHVASALSAARTLLALRPAESLYRALYWAIGLTLLPAQEAVRLSLPLRVVKRLTRDWVIPRLHRIKRRFPRMVMPGGLIERHLSRLHFGTNYHSVNLADLVRVRRRFPREDFGSVVEDAINAVTRTSLLRFWVDVKQKQALGYWVEALYQACTLMREGVYRRHLAEAMICASDAGLGMPPSLLGAHPEVVKPGERVACPSPRNPCLRVANLSRTGRREILVVNNSTTAVELEWERNEIGGLAWTSADGPVPAAPGSPLTVPAKGWLLGEQL